MNSASFTKRNHLAHWHEVKRVIRGEGEPWVKQTTCCCASPGASSRECSIKANHKSKYCRCYCHKKDG